MVCPTAASSPSRIQSQCRAWKRNGKIIVAGVGKQRFDVLRKTWKRCRVEKKNRTTRSAPLKSGERGLQFSSPLPTLRLTPLPSALRAARAHDAVLRMYPGLPLRFIKIHGDILVSYAFFRTFLILSFRIPIVSRLRRGIT